MPMETAINAGVRPVDRPQTAVKADGVTRQDSGSTASAFMPKTNVAIETAIGDMAGILNKIASSQVEAAEKMPEELRENIGFVSFSGFIGRYNYFLNLVLLNMISLVFTTPITGYYLNGADNFNSLIDFTSCFTLAPIGVRIWSLIGSVIASYIIISNVIRRLNDINGGENKSMNYGISAVFVTLSFGYIFPSFLAILIYIFGTIVAFWVLLKKGKITGAMQYDYKKDFNWGAFFGTWIWGLVNKSYKTLWMLLLWCTPWGPLFGIYCGLKGNEWAGTNKDWDNLDQFQKSQKKQSIIFIILS